MRYAIVSADTYEIAERFRHFLRVTDVVDGLDAVGRADVTLVDAAIRPLWFGLSFWGPAVTMRVVPANQRMPLVDREDALRQHGLWFQQREQRLGRWRGPAIAGPRPAWLRRRDLDWWRQGVWLLGFQQLHGS